MRKSSRRNYLKGNLMPQKNKQKKLKKLEELIKIVSRYTACSIKECSGCKDFAQAILDWHYKQGENE